MQLARPFHKLPVRFCAETLAREVQALPVSAWSSHPTGFPGNEAVRLITPGGRETDDLEGPMAPTEHLFACPYGLQIMAELRGVWGRSRFMRLAAGSEVPAHVDSHYYWRTHLRIHIPVITNPEVRFTCGDETVHMAAGECWVFDSFRRHDVQNRGSEDRVHLVLDTVTTEHLWDFIDSVERGTSTDVRLVEPDAQASADLSYEQVNTPTVMSPWEIRSHIAFLGEHLQPHEQLPAVMRRLDRFVSAWAGVWAQYGTSDAGLPTYRQMLLAVREDLNQLRGGGIMLDNGKPLYLFLEQLIFVQAAAGDRIERDLAAAPAGQRLAS